MRIAIIEDDPGIRRILKNTLRRHELGELVGESGDGRTGETLLLHCRPDIALIDLLLPLQDGLQIVKNIRAAGSDTSVIMISKANTASLISDAYRSGIEFFIHKPLNILELISVVNTVQEKRSLKQLLTAINATTAKYSGAAQGPAPRRAAQKERVWRLFSELGIIGDAGAQDICRLVGLITRQGLDGAAGKYQLLDLYRQAAAEQDEDANTIKQRVRRAVARAMAGIAGLGADDYGNETFHAYAAALFDFNEVRREMDYINHKSPYHGKVNVKKFLEGLIFLTRRTESDE